MTAARSLHVTAALIRAYSRRGNYHTDAAEAERIGLPGLVAQGMQVTGPAYGLLLDEWGEEFLAHGELELRFVGMVTEDQTVDASVVLHDGTATLEVTNRDAGRAAVVGRATRRGPLGA